MRTKRPMFASSSGASTSSRMQKGEGLYWKIAKSSEIAVSAFSPPESSITFCRRLPGGCAITSMPLSSTSSSSSSDSPAVPPPKSCVKISPKCWLMTSKASLEALARGAVDLLDGLVELGDRVEQVLALRGQEGVALLELLRLLDGEDVHRAHLVEPLAHLLDALAPGPRGRARGPPR